MDEHVRQISTDRITPPAAWEVETERRRESSMADDLLQRVRQVVNPETAGAITSS